MSESRWSSSERSYNGNKEYSDYSDDSDPGPIVYDEESSELESATSTSTSVDRIVAFSSLPFNLAPDPLPAQQDDGLLYVRLNRRDPAYTYRARHFGGRRRRSNEDDYMGIPGYTVTQRWAEDAVERVGAQFALSYWAAARVAMITALWYRRWYIVRLARTVYAALCSYYRLLVAIVLAIYTAGTMVTRFVLLRLLRRGNWRWRR